MWPLPPSQAKPRQDNLHEIHILACERAHLSDYSHFASVRKEMDANQIKRIEKASR
jgi:hypothetical protein